MELSIVSAEFQVDAQRRRGCNPATIAFYGKSLRWLAEFLAPRGITALESVRLCDLEEYVADLRARPRERRAGKLSPVTIRKRVLFLKTFFGWCVARLAADGRPYLAENPALRLDIPKKPKRIPKHLTRDQVTMLLRAQMSVRDRAIICILLDTGMRLAECAKLDVSDVDIGQRTIRIRSGKGDKDRMVVFAHSSHAALWMWLAERRNKDPALFTVYHGSRMSASGMYKAIKAVAESVGLGDVVSPHVLRHSFATHSLNNGAGLQTVSKLLGHSSITTTMIYWDAAVEDLQEQHMQFSPLDHLKK